LRFPAVLARGRRVFLFTIMASLLQQFTQAAFSVAQTIIGTETLSISGGAGINGVMNESTFSRDYEAGGFEQSGALDFVIDRTTFAAAYPDAVKSYEGKSAVARGENWRIGTIRGGGPSDGQFITLSLVPANKSA